MRHYPRTKMPSEFNYNSKDCTGKLFWGWGGVLELCFTTASPRLDFKALSEMLLFDISKQSSLLLKMDKQQTKNTLTNINIQTNNRELTDAGLGVRLQTAEQIMAEPQSVIMCVYVC